MINNIKTIVYHLLYLIIKKLKVELKNVIHTKQIQ